MTQAIDRLKEAATVALSVRDGVQIRIGVYVSGISVQGNALSGGRLASKLVGWDQLEQGEINLLLPAIKQVADQLKR